MVNRHTLDVQVHDLSEGADAGVDVHDVERHVTAFLEHDPCLEAHPRWRELTRTRDRNSRAGSGKNRTQLIHARQRQGSFLWRDGNEIALN